MSGPSKDTRRGAGDAPAAVPAPAAERALTNAVKEYYARRIGAAAQAAHAPAPARTVEGAARSPEGACCGSAVPSFGCGQPTLFAELRPGESVLDLGSGAGLDVFRAAEAVGPAGHAIGVDMTPEMIAHARAGAEKLGLANAGFRLGAIEALPVEDASVDVVISNCVVNLSQDKAAVFEEAARVLRPGGRVAISDVLRLGDRRAAVDVESWCACVGGAEPPERYRQLLREAGFVEVRVDPPPAGLAHGATYSASVRALRPVLRLLSPRELGAATALLEASGLPTAGIEAGTRLYGCDAPDGGLAALAGIELYGSSALLRSLAVRGELRGRGYGHAMLAYVLHEASRLGASAAYALTTTIPDLLGRLGFDELDRAELPSELNASTELRGACPATARAFLRRLPAR